MLSAVWYHLQNLKNVKNAHGAVLLFVKLQASACKTLLHWCFSRFSICTNGTKIAQSEGFLMFSGGIEVEHELKMG